MHQLNIQKQSIFHNIICERRSYTINFQEKLTIITVVNSRNN